MNTIQVEPANQTHVTQLHGGEADKYRAILDRKIAEGAAKAGNVFQTIFTQVPKDQIIRTRAVNFFPHGETIGVEVGDNTLHPSDFALGQLAEKASVPGHYLKDLAKGGDWQRDLAATILARHYSNAADDSRMLARSVNGQLRGWVSDRFRRLDCRPLAEALGEEATATGAVLIDGTATDTRVAIKLAIPEIIEPVRGEFLVYGIEWSNSDYGNGTHSIRAFALRVACLNGMTRENLLRQVHLGGRLGDDITFSDKTYQLDTETSVSALRDMVRGSLGPAGRESMTEKIRAASEREMSKGQLVGAVKTLPKAQQKLIVDAFESEDCVNLPEGKTAWRGSNAVSWIARHTKDDETRLDLERLAGSLA
jgi:hypothetical protein